jgi:peptide deformylase
MNVVDYSEVPLPPYGEPTSPAKALSLSMKLEDICRRMNLAGLSAPQVGIAQDLFVYWSNYPDNPKVFSVFMGCDYTGNGDKFLSLESCATFPNDRFGVMRYASIKARGRTLKSNEGKIEIVCDDFIDISGPIAAIVQHELDHIKGIGPNLSGERMFFR